MACGNLYGFWAVVRYVVFCMVCWLLYGIAFLYDVCDVL